jgi:hypothetical protein
MSGSTNPLIPQGGPISRVRVNIVFGSFSNMNVTASNLGPSFATIAFNDPFTTQIKTATGIINSPEPYVMGSITFGLLRTQPLAGIWLTQIQATTILGASTIHSDTSAFGPISLAHTAITAFNPTAFDGRDATIAVTLMGVYYVNNNLWSFT